MKKQLLKKKSIAAVIEELGSNNTLKKTLSTHSLIALGIGAVVGTGIFVVTGQAAALYAGPALSISFVISAICCVMCGLCYAEFASMIPASGSVYSYSYSTLGEIFAWFSGWILIIEYILGVGSVAVGWSGYLNSLLTQINIHIPTTLASSTFIYIEHIGWKFSGSIINLPAVFIIVLLSSFLIGGTKQSAVINNIIVAIKLIVIFLFIGFGISFVHTANWHPFIPKNTGYIGHYGWSGIFRGAGIVFYAYLGFDALATASEETKNPQKDMPKAILISLAICALLYIAVTMILTGIVNFKYLNIDAPIAFAIDKTGHGLSWLSPFIKIGALAGLSSVILVLLMGQSRIYYSIAKDGLIPKFFSKIHSKSGSPRNSIYFTCIICVIFGGLFPLNILSQMVCIGTLIAFSTVCVSVLVLRKTQPNINRPFKTPFVPIIPILGAGICIFQMVFLPSSTWYMLIGWVIIGALIYFCYGIKNSKLNPKNYN